jgi:hypothetical protein
MNKVNNFSAFLNGGVAGTALRWQIVLGNNATEGGTADGSDFEIRAYDNVGTGAALRKCLKITRADAAAQFFGTVTVPGGTVQAPSDVRIKTDLVPFTDGLAVIKNLTPTRYRYDARTGMDTAERIGLIAQEAEQAAPYMVHVRAGLGPAPMVPDPRVSAPLVDDPTHDPASDTPPQQAPDPNWTPPLIEGERTFLNSIPDLRNLDSGPLVYLLLNAVKELAAKVEALEARRAKP